MKLQSLVLFLFIFCYGTASSKCPDPPIKCFWCVKNCPETYILLKSPCGCCHDMCIPNETLSLMTSTTTTTTTTEAPCTPDICDRVKCPVPKCKNGYILVEGAGLYGCCPGCVKPNETTTTTTTEAPCPPDICRRVKCAPPKCKEGYILVDGAGFCGCCPDCVKKNETTTTTTTEAPCPKDICHKVKCAPPKCKEGYILVEGAGFCGCCPDCVKKNETTTTTTTEAPCPKDICHKVKCEPKKCKEGYILVEGAGFCGCCPDCVKKNETTTTTTTTTEAPCPPKICHTVKCALPKCKEGYILVDGAGFCGCCPDCVEPKKGDKCYKDFDTGQPTCGSELKCCKEKCISRKDQCEK